MSALLDAILGRVPLSHVVQQEARELDAEFLRRHREAHPEDFTREEVSAVLTDALRGLVPPTNRNEQPPEESK